LTHNEDDAVIVSSTVRLGHDLGLRVVAEGVESREQVEQLTGLGCDLVQGFEIARPMPGEELGGWFAQAESTRSYTVAAMPAAQALAARA
jgi:EAL domain-containing protein (putative c-di-GMP-specific phosphodiesterase class I)